MLRMSRTLRAVRTTFLLLVLAVPAVAQEPGLPTVPPPVPPKPKPENAPEYKPIAPVSEEPWGLNTELLENLASKAAVYEVYTKRFTCEELATLAEYDNSGQVKNERVRRYGYLLVQDEIDHGVSEYRQEFGKDGSLKGGEVKDEEPFPPAYGWVFLFSRFNEPYFSFRLIEDRFDGFDWVYEIQFRGALQFTDGKDIREWEGTVLVDAVTHTPLEILAEPAGQQQRIEELYRRHQSSFNIMGMRTAPRPLGFRARIQFRHRHRDAGLTFPTDLRYDTFTAVTVSQTMPVKASSRAYSKYRVFTATLDEELGEPADGRPIN